MAGRGCFYRAEILTRQGNLGKAEYCVNLAEQIIAACETSLDTGLIAYERACILIEFIGRTPHRSLKQVNEARSYLEKCIDVCAHLEAKGSQLSLMKHFFLLVLGTMAILLLDCHSDTARRKRTVSKEFIAKSQWCLNTMRNSHWSEMTLSDRVYFYLSGSDLEYRRNNYAQAEEFALLAKDKAVEMRQNMEASQAQKRLDFLRGISHGDTIDNDPKRSESEGENADISSSGSESNWLTAILNWCCFSGKRVWVYQSLSKR